MKRITELICELVGHQWIEFHMYEVVCSRCRTCRCIACTDSWHTTAATVATPTSPMEIAAKSEVAERFRQDQARYNGGQLGAATVAPAGQPMEHRIECNFWNQPVGGPGCICWPRKAASPATPEGQKR